jgi:hypothetical protein
MRKEQKGNLDENLLFSRKDMDENSQKSKKGTRMRKRYLAGIGI